MIPPSGSSLNWPCADIRQGPPVDLDWRTVYLDWLIQQKLPEDRAEARRITRRAKTFVIIDGELYK